MNYEAVNIYKQLKSAAIQQQQAQLKRATPTATVATATGSAEHVTEAPRSPGEIGTSLKAVSVQSDSEDDAVSVPSVEAVSSARGTSCLLVFVVQHYVMILCPPHSRVLKAHLHRSLTCSSLHWP